jgi:hypothetical protein
MLPICGVPATIQQGLAPYRDLFCRDEGFTHISRYITGLILSPNKTLQGIYDLQVWDAESPSRRAMHAAVFEAQWDAEALMPRHRAVVAQDHGRRGREVISLDWTLAHHEWGPKIYGVTKSYDYVERRMARFQTVVTAVVANRALVDGIEVRVQTPNVCEAEEDYLRATGQERYEQLGQARERLLELLHHLHHRREYKKRTEIVVEIVEQIEREGHFPEAHYAFDNGVLTVELTRWLESQGKHWVSEVECSRNILWRGQWCRIDAVAAELRHHAPQSFRPLQVHCRSGETKTFWAFTKTVRLRRYGRKRIVINHEREDLTDAPRFLLTDALHWESGRIIETWSFRWTAELFHAFGKQGTGLEAAQVRTEEAVKRHLRLSCVAQSLLQRAPAVASSVEKFAFAQGQITLGQRCRVMAREVFHTLLQVAQRLFTDGRSCEQVLEVFMPA